MNVKRSIRVILADDHASIRRGIRRILEKDPNFEVIAETNTGAGAIHLVNELRPDVLLLDIEMPDMKGYHVARELRGCHVPVSILALSSNDGNYYMAEVLGAGMDGYVTKSKAAETIQQAIYAITKQRSLPGVNPI